MKNKLIYFIIPILVIIALILWNNNGIYKEYLNKESVDTQNLKVWNTLISDDINNSVIELMVDGKQYFSPSSIYMNENLTLMVSYSIIVEAFNCAANIYDDNTIVIEKGTDSVKINFDTMSAEYNDEAVTLSEDIVKKDGVFYIPITVFTELFDYTLSWDANSYTATLVNNNSDTRLVPYYYSYVDAGRAPEVKNQGNYGTCWAFAALTALESSLLPEENYVFSEDHMSMSNSYGLDQNSGGDYTMSLAYLAAWQGPVLEEDDPYGDGQTVEGLEAVKHVQEVQIIESNDYESIKKMVFQYGGVQSSLYTSLKNSSSSSYYYNKETYAYCYIGTEKANHDVVIIGWDDNYSKDNFSIDVEGDGAFICRNSWGSEFGDNGNFYVSYYDTNIGMHNVVYTNIQDNDNYDNIYQSDLCGWTGSIGFGSNETAYFANVYTCEGDEELAAVSFYAPVVDTQYEIYICTDYEDINSLNDRTHTAASGTFTNSGYYTVDLDEAYRLTVGEKYAVIVKLYTPNCEKPIAVELKGDGQTKNIDLSDGEGYFSLYGSIWQSAEDNDCNLCLKAFTDNVE